MTATAKPAFTHAPGLPWLQESRRVAVEEFVSAHQGRPWRIKTSRDLHDLASHPCALLADDTQTVFIKVCQAANALDQLTVEVAGLRALSTRAGVQTPIPIGLLPVEGAVLLVLEAVQAVEHGPHQWRQIGQTLARLHQHKGSYCGWETQGYFGPLYQDNRPLADWPTFFAERRLWPRFMAAIDTGHLPTPTIRLVEQLLARLPTLCGPSIAPALLHGDAQQNNFISTAEGTVVIDPAVHYGHPEVDLAHLDYFQPVPDDVFAGYQTESPLDPGFWARRALWRIPTHLAMVAVGGAAYVGQLTAALEQYV
ncbi:MAG: fructosamine kinase family protein [Caldilineaceae bacterium]|nr:fructosamine kinase family protein [Caldilineaceae bacterium]